MRGNGKIIQELEAAFRGAGWNVIKVIWAREWDDLLARDIDGVLVQQMNETLDGEFQKFSVAGGAYIREHFFGPDPRLRKLVEHLSDDDLAKLRRGGHDYRKVYAAYKAATEHTGAPTVDPRQDRQGLDARPGRRGAQHHPPGQEADRGRAAHLPRPARAADPGREAQGRAVLPPGPEVRGGRVPARAPARARRAAPEARRRARSRCRRRRPRSTPSSPAAARRPVSTTMVFSRLLRNLIRDKELGPRIVPIIPDEARTFGMDPLFKEVGIYAALGQRYEPVDSDLVLSYREATDGQVLEEGITEAGSMASLPGRRHGYATHGQPMIPFYIFYSMFGFQRTGDQIWAFGDARGRGFLMGATAGRTTLTGEGLQHDDGHSHLLASTVPNIRAYDPAFAYELAVIVRDGIERMYGKGEDVFYYVTLYNENYAQPPHARGRRGGDPPRASTASPRRRTSGARRSAAQLVGSGSILQQVLAAQDLLAEKYDVAADVWSAPSFQLLRNDALEVERWNRLHPDARRRASRTSARSCRRDGGPIVAATDYMKALPDMVARWLPAALRLARHRRLRPQRHARGPARALRDRPAAHRRGDAGRARPLRRAPTSKAAARRSASSASTPTRSTRSPSSRRFGPGSEGRCIVAALHRGPQP